MVDQLKSKIVCYRFIFLVYRYLGGGLTLSPTFSTSPKVLSLLTHSWSIKSMARFASVISRTLTPVSVGKITLPVFAILSSTAVRRHCR